jgi:hypothetical protein
MQTRDQTALTFVKIIAEELQIEERGKNRRGKKESKR